MELNKMTKSELMKKAWAIAKQMADERGGKSRGYLSEAIAAAKEEEEKEETPRKEEAATGKKVVGYVRVSTQAQANEGVSLDAQRAKIEAYALVESLPIKVFADEGVSGSIDSRQGLADALASLNKGDVLVVYSLSRLARSTRHTLTIAELLERKGCDLVSLSEKIDTTSAAGRMVFRMLSVLGEFEREQIVERTKTALAYKRSRGQRMGRISFGYRVEEGSKTLIKDEHEQKVLACIDEMRSRGYSYQRIADYLNAVGMKKREGTQWKKQNVHLIMKHRLVA
jgi:DNA invertase Pin-like site-specific DNA recombinase